MTFKQVSATFVALSVTFCSFAAGFALYEGSARGNALGGGVMGRAVDASANFYNPATLTDMTGTVVTVGMTTEHPTADTFIDGHPGRKMDPGCFVLPHLYLAQELGAGYDNSTMFISHGDCREDADYLAQQLKEQCGVKEVVISYVGAVIGSHSGPGTLALFFLGKHR